MPDRYGILAIDVGTSSTKAVLFETGGAIVAGARRSYPMLTPRPGWAEQDPDAVVTAALDASAVVAAAGRAQQVAIVALGLSTAMHTLLGLDAGRRPVTPLLTWADERATGQAERLRADPAGQRPAAGPAVRDLAAPDVAAAEAGLAARGAAGPVRRSPLLGRHQGIPAAPTVRRRPAGGPVDGLAALTRGAGRALSRPSLGP